MTGEESDLTLTISQINAAGSAGQATVSGSLNSKQISREGQIDLTVNPFIERPVQGWPSDAFASQGRDPLF